MTSKDFHFVVREDGTINDYCRRLCANAIREHAGKQIKVSIGEKAIVTSDNQRQYYFGVIIPAFIAHFSQNGQSFTKEQMHDSMMRAIGGFANAYVNPFNGEPDQGRVSYTKLTRKQTEGYHTLCRKWAAEHGFDIPEPNEDKDG